MRVATGSLVLALVAVAGCGGDAGSACGNAMEQEELRVTNVERAGAGLPAYVCDEDLTIAARLHAEDMCAQNYFSHDSLDGRTFTARINAEDVMWTTAGENIARGQNTAEDVHAAWMGSTGHRANILSADFMRIGIGYVECAAGGGPFWVQDFVD